MHAEEVQSTELSEIQVAELRKAFAICDQDGNGVIDASELRTVIRAILDEDPSEEEFQQVKTVGCKLDSIIYFRFAISVLIIFYRLCSLSMPTETVRNKQ